MTPSSAYAGSTSTASAASLPAPERSKNDGYEDRSLAYQHTLQALLSAQRDALLRMRDERKISNETMNRILQELDLEESRLKISAPTPHT
jgi:hypothetical protein